MVALAFIDKLDNYVQLFESSSTELGSNRDTSMTHSRHKDLSEFDTNAELDDDKYRVPSPKGGQGSECCRQSKPNQPIEHETQMLASGNWFV